MLGKAKAFMQSSRAGLSRASKYSTKTEESSASAPAKTSSTGTSFFSRMKQRLMGREKTYDNSVDMDVAAPHLGRSRSTVSFAGDSEYDEYDEREGSESDASMEEPEVAQEPSEPEEPFETLSDAGSVDLMDLVREVHPQVLLMPQEQLEMEREIKSKLHRMRAFNMTLMRGPERPVKADQGPRKAPRLVVVGGHTNDLGNRNINGIYEKMPGSFNGRPWYRKTIQRMPDLEPDPAMGPPARKLPRVPGYKNPMGINEGDFEDPSIAQIAPATDKIAKVLYFDDRHGQWKIASNPKESKCFARCSDSAADVPHRLRNWQVWDVKIGDWYFHPTMYCERGGA